MVKSGYNSAADQKIRCRQFSFFLSAFCFCKTASFTKAPNFYIVLRQYAVSAVTYATNSVLLLQLWDVNPLRTFQQSSPDP